MQNGNFVRLSCSTFDLFPRHFFLHRVRIFLILLLNGYLWPFESDGKNLSLSRSIRIFFFLSCGQSFLQQEVSQIAANNELFCGRSPPVVFILTRWENTFLISKRAGFILGVEGKKPNKIEERSVCVTDCAWN